MSRTIGHVSDITIISPLDAAELEERLDDSPICEYPHEILAAAGYTIACGVVATHRLFIRCAIEAIGQELWRPMICRPLVDYVLACLDTPCVAPLFIAGIPPHSTRGCWEARPL